MFKSMPSLDDYRDLATEIQEHEQVLLDYHVLCDFMIAYLIIIF